MRFDWTLNAGHILTAGAMVASVFLAWGNLKSTDALTDLRLRTLEAGFSAMADQNGRLLVLENIVRSVPNQLDGISEQLEQLNGNGDFR
jgi:hypothetical protein